MACIVDERFEVIVIHLLPMQIARSEEHFILDEDSEVVVDSMLGK